MKDDELLEALGARERARREAEQRELDARWDALAAGELSDLERERLLAETDVSEQAAAAYEAFRPLGAEFRARVVDRVAAQAREGGDVGREGGSGPGKPRGGANVVPLVTRKRPRAWAPLALAASLLAAVGIAVLLQRPDLPLPGYGLRLEGALSQMRSTPTQVLERAMLVPGNHLRLIATPETRVEGKVTTRLYTVRDGLAQPLEGALAEVSDDGAVLFEGEVGRDLILPPGQFELLIVVGRPGSLPDTAAALEAARDGRGPGEGRWTAYVLPLELEVP